MSSFEGYDEIILQPNDQISYEFNITVESSQGANDGFLPYGRSVSSVAVSGYSEDGITTDNHMIVGLPSVVNNLVSVVLRYPSAGVGRYRLEMVLTLDNGQTKEADFSRIQAIDY